MTVQLVELLVGLYFVGVSISWTPKTSSAINVDVFKLSLGVSLVLLALAQGVRLI